MGSRLGNRTAVRIVAIAVFLAPAISFAEAPEAVRARFVADAATRFVEEPEAGLARLR